MHAGTTIAASPATSSPAWRCSAITACATSGGRAAGATAGPPPGCTSPRASWGRTARWCAGAAPPTRPPTCPPPPPAGDVSPGGGVLCYPGGREGRRRGGGRGGGPLAGLHVPAGELGAHCGLLRESSPPFALAAWRPPLAGGPPLPPRPVLLT